MKKITESRKASKIDFETLVNDLKIKDIELFTSYLTEIWLDLSLRSDRPKNGVSKCTFMKYYALPGIISERLFSVFDKAQDNYLSTTEFTNGMKTIFCGDYEEQVKFIFDVYDFGRKGYLVRNDVKVVFSYIPLNNKISKLIPDQIKSFKYETNNFTDQLNSQHEVNKYLDLLFQEKTYIEETHYKRIIDEVSSETFLYLIFLLLDSKPFTKASLTASKVNSYRLNEEREKQEVKTYFKKQASNPILIATPSLKTSFNPSGLNSKGVKRNNRFNNFETCILKQVRKTSLETKNVSSVLTKGNIFIRNKGKIKAWSVARAINKHIQGQRLSKLKASSLSVTKYVKSNKTVSSSRKTASKRMMKSIDEESKVTLNIKRVSLLKKVIKDDTGLENRTSPSVRVGTGVKQIVGNQKPAISEDGESMNESDQSNSNSESQGFKQIRRKQRSNLKGFQFQSVSGSLKIVSGKKNSPPPTKRKMFNEMEFNEIFPAKKIKLKKSIISKKKEKLNKDKENREPKTLSIELPKTLSISSICSNVKPTINSIKNIEEFSESDEDDDTVAKYEGFVYRVTQTEGTKKQYLKLINKDLYYYKNKGDTLHQTILNLAGVYIKKGQTKMTHDGKAMNFFTLFFPHKSRVYLCENEKDFQSWVNVIRQVTGYVNLNEAYEVGEQLGEGKFGLVKVCVQKQTKREAAIKIISKKALSVFEYEQVLFEIEILKVCQHPNIIRLYDVFENQDFIYIITEICKGADMFEYLNQRKFNIPESRAAEMVGKLARAIYYLHFYGISHRDLKPENILMTDNSDTADLKILDFGLSKILGPEEKSTEMFGTLHYVAPEVLLGLPYDNKADLWSLGIIAYILITGHFPFNSDNENEVARQIVYYPLPFPKILWKKKSLEAMRFVSGLLEKDPKKRMTIKEVISHPWIRLNTPKTNSNSNLKVETENANKDKVQDKDKEKEQGLERDRDTTIASTDTAKSEVKTGSGNIIKLNSFDKNEVESIRKQISFGVFSMTSYYEGLVQP